MTANKFARIGFAAGPITIAWNGDSHEIRGRGRVHGAEIIRMETPPLPRDVLNAALTGLVVYASDGVLSRITGVETFAVTHIGEHAKIGLLLVPLDPAP